MEKNVGVSFHMQSAACSAGKGGKAPEIVKNDGSLRPSDKIFHNSPRGLSVATIGEVCYNRPQHKNK